MPRLRDVEPSTDPDPPETSTSRIVLYIYDLYRHSNGLPAAYRGELDANLYRLFGRGMTELAHRLPRNVEVAEWTSIPLGYFGPDENSLFDPIMSILPSADNEETLDFITNHISVFWDPADGPFDPLRHPFIRILCPNSCEQRAKSLGLELRNPIVPFRPISDAEKVIRPEWKLVAYGGVTTRLKTGKGPVVPRHDRYVSGSGSAANVCCDGAHYEPRNYENKTAAATEFIDDTIKQEPDKKTRDDSMAITRDVLRLFAILEELYRTHEVPRDYDAVLDLNLWYYEKIGVKGSWSVKVMECLTGWNHDHIYETLLWYTWEPRTRPSSPGTPVRSLFSTNIADDAETLRSVANACVSYYGRKPFYAIYDGETSNGNKGALKLWRTQLANQRFQWHYNPQQDRFLSLLFPGSFADFNFASLKTPVAAQENPDRLLDYAPDRLKFYPLFSTNAKTNCLERKSYSTPGYMYDPDLVSTCALDDDAPPEDNFRSPSLSSYDSDTSSDPDQGLDPDQGSDPDQDDVIMTLEDEAKALEGERDMPLPDMNGMSHEAKTVFKRPVEGQVHNPPNSHSIPKHHPCKVVNTSDFQVPYLGTSVSQTVNMEGKSWQQAPWYIRIPSLLDLEYLAKNPTLGWVDWITWELGRHKGTESIKSIEYDALTVPPGWVERVVSELKKIEEERTVRLLHADEDEAYRIRWCD